MSEKPSLMIESYASTYGWRAVCKGVRTGGPWSPEERQWHINCLEVLAAFHALKSFVRDQEKYDSPTENGQYHSGGLCQQAGRDSVPQAQLHSQRAMAMVHEQGHYPGGRTPARSPECNSRQGIPSDERSLRLDAEPQDFTRWNWRWSPLEVDLFASRLTIQLQRLFSWRPDPEAEALDAFNQDWSSIQGKGYANPPWNLVSRVLNRMQQLQVTLVLVAPVWKSQPWYPNTTVDMFDFHLLHIDSH